MSDARFEVEPTLGNFGPVVHHLIFGPDNICAEFRDDGMAEIVCEFLNGLLDQGSLITCELDDEGQLTPELGWINDGGRGNARRLWYWIEGIT